MAGNSLIFKDAEKARDAVLSSQKKEIAALYDKWADEIGERAKYYSHKSTASSVVSERQMRELQKQIRATSQEVSNEVYSMIKKNMYTVADSVVQCNSAWLASLGFDGSTINAAFSSVPDDVVRNLLTGQIYDSGWSLSSRIWGDNENTLKDIYQVMAKGLTENKSIYDIAKELESYVRPGAKLPWNLKMADGAKIYKKQVDYNAQRLARTLTQHGYQQSFIATTQKNPFITDYIWRSNGSRVCELCAERDGKHFKKTELPMDHPNGMCTMEPNIVSDMNDQLADWFNSPDGTYPEIDAFANNFGYKASKIGTVSDFIGKYGTSTKSPNAWFNGLTPIQKAEAKALKDQSGLTWNKWYEKNVYVGDGSNLAAKKKVKLDVFDKNAWYDLLKKNNLKAMNGWTNDWLQLITSEERHGVQVYTGSAYYDMNKYLRGQRSTTSYAEEIKQATAALKKASLPEEVIVRRGSDYNMLRELGIDISEANKDKLIGAIVTDKGFMSTSPASGGGFSGDIEYVIKVPQGSQAMYVDTISRHSGEEELLINRGGKYIVEDVEFDRYGDVKKIYMTLKNLKGPK